MSVKPNPFIRQLNLNFVDIIIVADLLFFHAHMLDQQAKQKTEGIRQTRRGHRNAAVIKLSVFSRLRRIGSETARSFA